MASTQVIDFVKAAVHLYAALAPWQDTTGMLDQQTNMPELWCTTEFSESSNQSLTIGDGGRTLMREYGQCAVLFLSKAGYSQDAVVAVAQAFSEAAQGLRRTVISPLDGTRVGRVVFDNVSPPNPEPYEDGNWLVCSVGCVYTFDRVLPIGQSI